MIPNDRLRCEVGSLSAPLKGQACDDRVASGPMNLGRRTAAGILRLRSGQAPALRAAFGRAVRKILHLAEVSGVG
jgi:hypothetical protein